MDEQLRLFRFSQVDAEVIRAAMAGCHAGENGQTSRRPLWSLKARTGPDWFSHRSKTKELLNSKGHHLQKGAEGFELGLFLNMSVTNMGDLKALSALCDFTYLELTGSESLSNLSQVSQVAALRSLNLAKSDALTDLSGIEELTALESLELYWCEALSDVSGLKSLSSLKRLNLGNCEALEDLSPLVELSGLQELDLSNNLALTDLALISEIASLERLNLTGCESLDDISGIQDLTALKTLSLSTCEELVELPGLETLNNLRVLDLSGCNSLSDITPIESLVNLRVLKLSGCDILEDCQALQQLETLQRLDLSVCESLSDLSGLSELNQLRTLDCSGCGALTDLGSLGGLEALESLNISLCDGISSVAGLQGLSRLKELDCNGCESLTDLSGLKGLASLIALDLSECLALRDLNGIRGLASLRTLDLSGCTEVADPAQWAPIEDLTQLRSLEGSFPTYFVARLLARNAADAGDLEFVRSNLVKWVEVAQRTPESPGLLSAVGRAAALEPEGYPALVELIALATTYEVADVDGLFAAACGLGEIESVEGALSAAVEQATAPLPPESLVALHRHRPHDTTLRDRTLLALQRSLESADAPDWCARTAQTLYEALSDPRYPLDTAVHETVANALTGRQFTAIEQALYGALSSDHAQAADSDWRDEFHATLLALGLAQNDAESRNQALSALASGLARAGDWGADRLDALLRAAAQVDADTSALQAAAARAHAAGDRWSAAEDALFAIARPAVRDECIRDLLSLVLASEGADRAQRAVGFAAGLSDPWDRAERLVSLGKSGQLLSDPIAYGHLIALLAEHPDAQLEVVTAAVKAQPALANVQTSSPKEPVTQREQELVERARVATSDAWRAAVSAVTPEHLAEVVQHVEDSGP